MNRGLFDGIIGHEKACEVLKRAIDSKQLSHAYLFIGPDNLGKTAVAEALIGNLSGPDVTFVSRLTDEKTGKLKSSISVAQIRDLREKLSMSAFGVNRKAVFIEEADRMQVGAANALLKTLEEPRGDALIILRAKNLESVPATIASRCQVVRFNFVAKDKIASALISKGLSASDAEKISELASGRPGVAKRLISDGEFRAEQEIALTSILSLLEEDLPGRMRILADLISKDEVNKAQVFEKNIDALERVLREIVLVSIGADEFVSSTHLNRIKNIAKNNDIKKWLNALDRLSESRRAILNNINPQIALEYILFAI